MGQSYDSSNRNPGTHDGAHFNQERARPSLLRRSYGRACRSGSGNTRSFYGFRGGRTHRFLHLLWL